MTRTKVLILLGLVAVSGTGCAEVTQLTAAPIDCGHYSVSGGTAGDGERRAKRCIRDALETGAPAYLLVDITGDGDGDAVEIRFDVLRKERVRVATDGHEQVCTGIADDGPALVGVDCEDVTDDG